MAQAFARNARTLHALRVATGSTAVVGIGLVVPVITPCISSLLFFVITVAGAAENTQGFQLRSASLSLLGTILGLLAYVFVALIADKSTIAAFFLALPPLAIFCWLRADPTLAPAPALANVIIGLLLVSHADTGRSAVVPALSSIALDVLTAWACAVFVNLLAPVRAADEARLLFADELRRIGAAFSTVATIAFQQPVFRPFLHPPPPLSLSPSLSTISSLLPVALPDYHPPPSFLPLSLNTLQHTPLERSPSMLSTTSSSLAFLTNLPPFGRTRAEDHSTLARTRLLVLAAGHEPRFHWLSAKSTSFDWGSAQRLEALRVSLLALVNRAACLESVTLAHNSISTEKPRHGAPALFSPDVLASFIGSAYIPLWYTHIAVCAAACASLSSTLDSLIMTKDPDMHLKPSNWRARRKEMYFGFMLARRLSRRRKGLDGWVSLTEKHDMETEGVRALDLEFNVNLSRRANRRSSRRCDKQAAEQYVAQRQAMSFFAIGCHSSSEAVIQVQEAVAALKPDINDEKCDKRESQVVLLPLLPGATAVRPILKRISSLFTGTVRLWELRFAATHFLLLATTLALALFLPFDERLRAGEVAWSYTSAALAAQLSAEPTVFIGTIRIGATAAGCFVGLVASESLRALAKAGLGSGILFARLPIVYIVCVVVLLTIPPRLRYLSFLMLVTTFIILFCPRATPQSCPGGSEETALRASCLPDWRLALSRAGNVSVGVVLALIFHVLFWPRYAGDAALRCLLIALRQGARQTHKLRLRFFALVLKHPNMDNGTKNFGEDEKEMSAINEKDRVRNELYPRDAAVAVELHKRVGSHVENAATLIHGEAGVWRHGPLRARPLLESVVDDMVALSVSIGELGGLQGRRAIFGQVYQRDVFSLLILPLLAQYETLQVSVNNMVAVTAAVANETRDGKELGELLDVLRSAIGHVARCRGELRTEARRRAGRLDIVCKFRSGVRARLSRWASGVDLNGETSERTGNRHRHQDDGTIDIGSSRMRNDGGVQVDEVVLYDGMTVVFDGCLSAFVRVALAVLEDGEARSRAMKRHSRGLIL